MTLNSLAIRSRLLAGDLRSLFIEELGWDNVRSSHSLTVGTDTYVLSGLAEKRGAQVFLCSPGPDGKIPERDVRAKLDTQLRKLAHEHLVIFVNAGTPPSEQLWQWVQSEPGKPRTIREHRFHASQTGEALIQKLLLIRFDIGEEEELTLAGTVLPRVHEAFGRRDKVTKRFFDSFQKEHKRFLGFIEGIQAQGDREWYASVMPNRLMFIYFIQQKRFLNNDPRYLRTKLEEVPRKLGKDRFHSFYRDFLRRLFHEGLAHQQPRGAEVDDLIGDVPYLNGGIFDVHQLERENTGVDIPDAAFDDIFAFFESYEWTLDTRELAKDNEINPDVLGYIFEKYINQKQMGAYYTKEDITGYISKNTVLPFLLDATRDGCKVAFVPNGPAWGLLQDDPDRYIYAAVRKGVDEPLPPEVEAGIAEVSKRGGWNKPAAAEFALPTETWREHVARRTRCLDLRAKLAAGEVSDVNDLITYNLDIRQFAQDVIERSEGPDVVRAFYKAIAEVSVLDPTCGSGAFLFAALNILEPLYEACLDRMDAWLKDEEQLGRMHPGHFFRVTLDQAAKHPNREYFVLKSIIINNLYGVDIMEEAVEICKLRLFLKLVAQVHDAKQIEPLPDIDFNIRAGNTLVGFTSLKAVQQAMTAMPNGQARMKSAEDEAELSEIDESAELVDRAYRKFREQQTEFGGAVTADDKVALRQRLEQLDARLDQHLARQYGVDPADAAAFEKWRASHLPFHWFVEFYGIMSRGGFDAIIGNPPYVGSANLPYLARLPREERFPDIYANVAIRGNRLINSAGRCSMIVPLSITFGSEYTNLRRTILVDRTGWFSSYDNIPAAIFAGVSQRCTIWLGGAAGQTRDSVYVTPMVRWKSASRAALVDCLSYAPLPTTGVREHGIPKVNGETAGALPSFVGPLSSATRTVLAPKRGAGVSLGFSQAARNFISVFENDPPTLDEFSLGPIPPSKIGRTELRDQRLAQSALAATAGDTYFWYWLVRGDGFDVTSWIINDFLELLASIDDEAIEFLRRLGALLHERRFEALQFKKNAGKYVGNFNYRRIGEVAAHADLVLLAALGVSAEDARSILDHVRRVLVINDQAGEKSIPAAVRSKFPTARFDVAEQARLFEDAKAWAARRFGNTPAGRAAVSLDIQIPHETEGD